VIASTALEAAAEGFCTAPPYKNLPFSKRNWGGTLHSLCSYQGKLKPSIAHFLISEFTRPGDRVLDPMSGVGTIPLEARTQGRIGLAGDLSPMAAAVSRAKLQPLNLSHLESEFDALKFAVASRRRVDRSEADFGLNGPISAFFHPDTLDEVLSARAFFMFSDTPDSPENALLKTTVMHLLHGNRPYALSRRSHPITPYAPSGEFEYRSLIERVERRLSKVVPLLATLEEESLPGEAREIDFRKSAEAFGKVDAVITSPPFSSSFRFWSMNWMRLWFSGWDRSSFLDQPARYLETQQRTTFAPYADFAKAMSSVLGPGGTLILHLGETAKENMAGEIRPYLDANFEVVKVGRESVAGSESHGIRDKGATVAHWFLFATRR
jgi:hypothetical protein